MKFFRNPLLYKEWKASKWIFVLMVIDLVVFKFMSIISSLSHLKILMTENPEYYNLQIKYWLNHELIRDYGNDFSNTFMFILIAMLSILLFMGERQISTCGLLASMPFKRKDIITAKWIIGLLTIFVAYMIMLMLLSIFFIANKSFIYQSYSLIINYISINMMTNMAIFSVIMIIQSLMGNNFIAAIVGSISVFVPSGLIYMINDYIRIHLNIDYRNPVIDVLNKLGHYLNICEFPNGTYQQGISSAHYSSHYYIYENFYPKLSILLVVIIAGYIVSRLTFENTAIENVGNITLFPFISTIFKWGVTICLGLFIGLVVGSGFSEKNIMVIDGFALIGSAVGYFASSKAIELSSNG